MRFVRLCVVQGVGKCKVFCLGKREKECSSQRNMDATKSVSLSQGSMRQTSTQIGMATPHNVSTISPPSPLPT